MIRKTALLVGAVLALSVMTVSPALADDDVTSCDEAKALVVKAQLRVDNRAAEERVEENAALDEAKKVVRAAQDAVDAANPVTDELRKALQDAKVLRDAAKDALDVDSRRLAELRATLTVAIQDRDKACDDDVTTTPTTPVPVDNDVDCDEVSDERAQEILDADKNDLNDLDSDDDGVACEEEFVDDDEVVVPAGGVNTGGGPA